MSGRQPLPAGLNGVSVPFRDKAGKFSAGNRFGRGNPLNSKAQKLRAALLRSVAVGDVRSIVKGLVEKAKEGDVVAAKVLLDRLLGPPAAGDLEDRIARLEALLDER